MSLSQPFNQSLLDSFIQLIATCIGLQIRSQDAPGLCQKINNRCRSINCGNPQNYYRLLSAKTPESAQEWQELIKLITTGESYFFRDRGQFTVLRDRLLPELIERQRKSCKKTLNARPMLKVWSAGCSTGEEAYSLAILLTELIPDWENWDLGVIGTDLNEIALEKARKGLYSDWSFRWVEPSLRKRYFQLYKNEWKVNENIANLVKFHYDNLVEDVKIKSSKLPPVDLVICRNVFVYFDANSIQRAVQKISSHLNSEGYLVAGHTELYGQNLSQFRIKTFPESVVYQRCPTSQNLPLQSHSSNPSFFPLTNLSLSTNKPLFSPVIASSTTTATLKPLSLSAYPTESRLSLEESSQKLLQTAEVLFQEKQYSQALKIAQSLIESKSHVFAAHYLIARIYANLGDLSKAADYCQLAVKINSLDVLPYFLLAHIAEEEGNIEKAKEFLKKVIYLEPTKISAYLELGALYTKQGELNRARRMWEIAVDLLQQLPPQAKIEYERETTVAELLPIVQRHLKNN